MERPGPWAEQDGQRENQTGGRLGGEGAVKLL